MAAKITLTTPEDRQVTVTQSDVTEVYIHDDHFVDHARKIASFRFSKTTTGGGTIALTSGVVSITGTDFDTYVDTNVAPDVSPLEELHRAMLQYLLDQGLVAAGTIS